MNFGNSPQGRPDATANLAESGAPEVSISHGVTAHNVEHGSAQPGSKEPQEHADLADAATLPTASDTAAAGVDVSSALADAAKHAEHVWSIAELADEFNVTHRTLRYYESLGLLAPERVGNKRLFSQRDRVRLALVLRGRRLGFGLDEIATIVNMYDETPGEAGQLSYLLSQIDDRRNDLLQRLGDIQAALQELETMRDACQEQLSQLHAAP